MNSSSVRIALLLLAVSIVSWPAIAQPLPTGPYPDESAYQRAAYDKTTIISGTDVVGVIQAVEMVVDDQIGDKCWTNATAISARIRSELERFGIAVYQEPLAFHPVFHPILRIGGLGYRNENGVCSGSATVSLYYFGSNRLGSLGYTGELFNLTNRTMLWEKNGIFTNSGNLDQQLIQAAQEWIDTLVGDISKARRTDGVKRMLAIWPESEPMTQVEFEAWSEAPKP